MAKIFSTPSEVKVPTISNFITNDGFDSIALEKAEKVFLSEIRDQLKKANPDDEYCGEVLNFPYADSYALYMVFQIKPLQLVHLPLGDAWDLPNIERLKTKDVLLKIEQQKSLNKLFNKK